MCSEHERLERGQHPAGPGGRAGQPPADGSGGAQQRGLGGNNRGPHQARPRRSQPRLRRRVPAPALRLVQEHGALHTITQLDTTILNVH